MAKVHITNVVVLDNPSSFFNPFQFELTFECIEELKEDLEWKMIYVGSAESEEHDQVLDTIYVGPVPEGRHIFVFQADPPDVTKIPEQDAVGVTIILLTCSYRGQEFVRVGYFINNDYADQEMRENPPPKPIFEKLTRNILATKPRVTRFKINWDDASASTSTGANCMLSAAEDNHMETETKNQHKSQIVGQSVVNSNMIVCNNGDNESAIISPVGPLLLPPQQQHISNGRQLDQQRDMYTATDVAMDENSINLPIENGVLALNENSNSLVMEC